MWIVNFTLLLIILIAVECYEREKIKREAIWHRPLSNNEKNIVVDKHNTYRQTVEPPASNMLLMSWDDDLEMIASEYSKKCLFEHNPQRSSPKYNYVGENIYASVGSAITEEYGGRAVELWDAEKEDYDYESNKCAPNKVCGHYTQVVWAESYKVGCAMATCYSLKVSGNKIWKNATIFICNYGPGGNIQGRKIYKTGKACSGCPDDHVCVNNLCTESTLNPVTEMTTKGVGPDSSLDMTTKGEGPGSGEQPSTQLNIWTYIIVPWILERIHNYIY